MKPWISNYTAMDKKWKDFLWKVTEFIFDSFFVTPPISKTFFINKNIG